MESVKSEKYSNEKFYKILKGIDSRKHLMTDEQNRLVQRYIRNFQLNGVHFDEANQKNSDMVKTQIFETQHNFRLKKIPLSAINIL